MRPSASRAKPSARPETGRSGPAAAAPGGAGAAGVTADQKSILKLQQSLGNQGVAELLADPAKAGPDQKLDPDVRQDMEERLGSSFEDVKVHTGQQADREARRQGAEAYATGDRVVLGGGVDQRSEHGRELLRHELAHVVQQREGAKRGIAADRISETAEVEAAAVSSDPDAAVREAAPAGAVQAKESPLVNAELSDEASERIDKVKEAAGEKWQDFDEWWTEHQTSGLAKAEEAEEGGEEFARVTAQIEVEMKDSFAEAARALRQAANQLRETNREGALQLDLASQQMESGAYLKAERAPAGLPKILETIRLFFLFKRIEDAAEDLRKIDVSRSPQLGAVYFDRLFRAAAALGELVPGGLIPTMEHLADSNFGGGFFPEMAGFAPPEDEIYKHMFEELDND